MSRVCCSFFFSSRRRHTRLQGDWSSDVCSSDLRYYDKGQEKEVAILAGGSVSSTSQPSGQVCSYYLIVCEPLRYTITKRSEERRVGKECRSRWWTCGKKETQRSGSGKGSQMKDE